MSDSKQPSPNQADLMTRLSTMDWRMWLLLLAGTWILAGYIQRPVDEVRAASSRFAVVDMDKILRAKSLAVGATHAQIDPVKVGEAADGFVRQLKDEVAQLKGQGLIVVNSAHLVAWPDAIDQTEELAATLGVNLEAVDAEEAARAARSKDLLDQAAAAQKR